MPNGRRAIDNPRHVNMPAGTKPRSPLQLDTIEPLGNRVNVASDANALPD